MTCCRALNQPVEIIGLCDPATITIENDPTKFYYDKDRNWTEISVPELLVLPPEKPDIETLDKVLIKVQIISQRLIDTPSSGTTKNPEGTLLSGKKLIIEGIIHQKIIYTANTLVQSVHSAHFQIPFSAFIIVRRDLKEPFCIDVCIEDVFVKAFGTRQIFKNVTLFLRAKPAPAPIC